MELDPLRAPPQSRLLSKVYSATPRMFVVGCCVHHRQSAAI
jgi:hypothetical protein